MKTKLGNIWKYILLILLIYLSGSIYFISFNYSIMVITTFLLTISLLFILNIKNKYTFSIRSVISMVILTLLISTTIILNQDGDIGSYVAIILQIVIAIVTTKIISIEEFKVTYINIIVFLAAISLIFHYLGLLIPNLVFLIPVTEGEVSVDYYNAFIHVYQGLKGYGNFVLNTRNAGIFWEPGAYQAFLNIGLLFILEEYRYKKKNKNLIKLAVMILIVTIITTYSPTGFVIMCLISIHYRNKLLDLLKIYRLIDLILIIILVLVGSGLIINEFQQFYGLVRVKYLLDASSWMERISLDKLGLIFSDFKIMMFGTSFENNLNTEAIWNSIIQTAVVFGLPFTLILLLNYWKSSVNLIKDRGLLFIILLLFFSTESFFWRPFFLYFAFIDKNNRVNNNIKLSEHYTNFHSI